MLKKTEPTLAHHATKRRRLFVRESLPSTENVGPILNRFSGKMLRAAGYQGREEFLSELNERVMTYPLRRSDVSDDVNDCSAFERGKSVLEGNMELVNLVWGFAKLKKANIGECL